jgi:hypothetical protein
MVAAAGQRLRAPDIRPLDVGRLRRIVLLPTHSNEQQLSWQTRGLNVEPLPGGFASESPQMELYRTCIVVGETFEARLKSVEKSAERPHAPLADIRAAFTGDRGGYGVATFDVEPSGATSFLLNVPAADRVVQVTVDGAPAVLEKRAGKQWLIGSASPKLPQRIEVTFEFAMNDLGDPEQMKLEGPSLAGFTVEQTIWSVADGPWSLAPQGRRTTGMSSLATAVVRVQTVSRELDSVVAALADETPEQVATAYLPWARRFLAARAAVERERSRAPSSQAAEAAEAEIRGLDEAQAKLARKLNVWSLYTELAGQRLLAGEAAELFDAAPRDRRTAALAVAGPSASLTLGSAGEHSGDIAARFLLACLAVFVIGVVAKSAGRPGVREFLVRWPQLLGVLFGLAWWLWLSPSLLGFGIVVAALVWPLIVHRQAVGPRS